MNILEGGLLQMNDTTAPTLFDALTLTEMGEILEVLVLEYDFAGTRTRKILGRSVLVLVLVLEKVRTRPSLHSHSLMCPINLTNGTCGVVDLKKNPRRCWNG